MVDELIQILQKFALTSKELDEVEIDLEDIGPSVEECGENLLKNVRESLVGRIKGEKVINFMGIKILSLWFGDIQKI